MWTGCIVANLVENLIDSQGLKGSGSEILLHSCIHDQILDQRRRPGQKVYSVTPQVYREDDFVTTYHHKGRSLLGNSLGGFHKDQKQPIRIFLNYDAVGSAPDRDCRVVGGVVKTADPPVLSDCWYNCTLEDVSGDNKKERLRKALEQTADWFKRALAVEHVKGNLRLSGYSACGQDGGVQLPHEYVEDGVVDADLVLLVTTRPTTGNTLAWAVACERDQWGRAIAGHVNVSPRHLTAKAETLLSATLIHEVTVQAVDEKLGRTVTRVVLPRVVMHSRHHYGAFSDNFVGLELEDGGGRGTSGSHWEKRLLMNEIMTGSVDTRSVVSKMTLALLEDSGWSLVKPKFCSGFGLVKDTLIVAVDGIWKVCPEAGGPVQFPGFNGELICPAYHELCSTAPVSLYAICDEQCSLHGGVCDNGVCEFRCSDYAGYTCQNSSTLLPILETCKVVLVGHAVGQHCAPSEPSTLQQLEVAVVKPNQDRLMPAALQLFSLFNRQYCSKAAKKLACWVCWTIWLQSRNPA
ncbi:hypothetical protein QJS10_CPA05g01604 [Acorus calamus]|uniref:Uncharacterized protein n=1 Tax=Acorus calamus TaxID=4465 RepID=A0AAV9EWE3_ACOCL|nr:hypothetical protein QJS10_CPA05g01604 [Acorus calamus]